MANELMLCIPGPWSSREEFLRAIVTAEPAGRYFYAGNILANLETKEHVLLEWYERDENVDMRTAFEFAGAGRIAPTTLGLIQNYQSVVYMRFPTPVTTQWNTISQFSELIRGLGGYAVKVESSGVAHEWVGWESLIASEDPFHWYLAFVTLVGNEKFYHSCGMHHFDEADTEISTTFSPEDAARLINNFNLYRLSSNPNLDNGHTLSLEQSSRTFEMHLYPDHNYEEDDLFHNPQGIWRLSVSKNITT